MTDLFGLLLGLLCFGWFVYVLVRFTELGWRAGARSGRATREHLKGLFTGRWWKR